jgi:anti-sigma B factor antagonist
MTSYRQAGGGGIHTDPRDARPHGCRYGDDADAGDRVIGGFQPDDGAQALFQDDEPLDRLRAVPRMNTTARLQVARGAGKTVIVITLFGIIDVFTAPRLRMLLVELTSAGLVHLVMEVEEAVFVDAAGLAALAGAWRRARERHGCLAVAGMSTNLDQALRAASLSHILPGASDGRRGRTGMPGRLRIVVAPVPMRGQVPDPPVRQAA